MPWSSFSLSHKDIPLRCEVVIVGGGVAGASAAYHLKNAGVRDIVVLETGKCGNGGHDAIIAPPHAVLRAGDDPGGVFVHAQRSEAQSSRVRTTAAMPARSK